MIKAVANAGSSERQVEEMNFALGLIDGMAATGLNAHAVFQRLLLAVRLMHGAAHADVRAVIERDVRELLALLYQQPPVERKET